MNRQLLKLYVEKFTKSEIDFHGIKLKLSLDSDENANLPLILKMENPLNKPYTRFAIEGEFINSFYSFVRLLGEEPRQHHPLLYCHFLNVKNIHITEDFFFRIKKAGQSIDTFNITGKDIGDYTMDLKYRNFDIDVNDDGIEVDVKFTVERLFNSKTNKELETIYLDKIFKNVWEYYNIPELNSEVCSPIASVIYSEPTFFDRYEAYIQFNCDYYTKAGTRIV